MAVNSARVNGSMGAPCFQLLIASAAHRQLVPMQGASYRSAYGKFWLLFWAKKPAMQGWHNDAASSSNGNLRLCVHVISACMSGCIWHQLQGFDFNLFLLALNMHQMCPGWHGTYVGQPCASTNAGAADIVTHRLVLRVKSNDGHNLLRLMLRGTNIYMRLIVARNKSK